MFCKDCNTTGSNLIGRITVGSDTITAYEAGLDPAVFITMLAMLSQINVTSIPA